MPVAEARLSPIVPPPPVPVDVVTVQVVLLPVTGVTWVTVAPDTPPEPPAKAKLALVTPLTGSEKVTRKWTLAAVVGSASSRLMLTMAGAIVSTVSVAELVAPQLPAEFLAWA